MHALRFDRLGCLSVALFGHMSKQTVTNIGCFDCASEAQTPGGCGCRCVSRCCVGGPRSGGHIHAKYGTYNRKGGDCCTIAPPICNPSGFFLQQPRAQDNIVSGTDGVPTHYHNAIFDRDGLPHESTRFWSMLSGSLCVCVCLCLCVCLYGGPWVINGWDVCSISYMPSMLGMPWYSTIDCWSGNLDGRTAAHLDDCMCQ